MRLVAEGLTNAQVAARLSLSPRTVDRLSWPFGPSVVVLWPSHTRARGSDCGWTKRPGQGIWSQHGFAVGESGQYAGRELLCHAPENTWLVECGRAADWGSFDAFVTALTRAEIEARDGVVSYPSPSLGRFVTGWEVPPTVEGRPIALHGYPLVESPWARSAFGSGELALTYGDERYELWFNQ